MILILVAGALVGIYVLKKESADGRLLLWKITTQAITKRPWTGTGLGGFPAAYAETQAEYFSSGKASETEMLVAGCPEYGFNEFLQIVGTRSVWFIGFCIVVKLFLVPGGEKQADRGYRIVEKWL